MILEEDLIPAAILLDTWPKDKWRAKLAATLQESEPPADKWNGLRDRAMDVFLERLLTSPMNNVGLLSEAEKLSEFRSTLKCKM